MSTINLEAGTVYARPLTTDANGNQAAEWVPLGCMAHGALHLTSEVEEELGPDWYWEDWDTRLADIIEKECTPEQVAAIEAILLASTQRIATPAADDSKES